MSRSDGIIKIKDLMESSRNSNTKPLGTPRGKAKWIPTDGTDLYTPAWEAKIKFWKAKIQELMGYEVLE